MLLFWRQKVAANQKKLGTAVAQKKVSVKVPRTSYDCHYLVVKQSYIYQRLFRLRWGVCVSHRLKQVWNCTYFSTTLIIHFNFQSAAVSLQGQLLHLLILCQFESAFEKLFIKCSVGFQTSSHQSRTTMCNAWWLHRTCRRYYMVNTICNSHSVAQEVHSGFKIFIKHQLRLIYYN